MKYCPGCKIQKSYSEFARNRKRKDGLQSYCRICKAVQDRHYYKTNNQAHKQRVLAYWNANRERLWKYLLVHPCIDCGESNPVVLEFDHRENKKGSISNLLNRMKYSWQSLEQEIAKCDIRCANCHRIKTAKQLNWYTYKGR